MEAPQNFEYMPGLFPLAGHILFEENRQELWAVRLDGQKEL